MASKRKRRRRGLGARPLGFGQNRHVVEAHKALRSAKDNFRHGMAQIEEGQCLGALGALRQAEIDYGMAVSNAAGAEAAGGVALHERLEDATVLNHRLYQAFRKRCMVDR